MGRRNQTGVRLDPNRRRWNTALVGLVGQHQHWRRHVQFIAECRPEWVFLENVAGHVTLGLETVLRELWGLGYTPAAGLFSAAKVGAPHQRLRIFILAHTDEPASRHRQLQPGGEQRLNRKAEALALGIARWSTPKASDGAKGGPGQSYGAGGTPPLPAQAAQWPSPAAQNWKESSKASSTRADGKSRMDILHYRAEQGFTRPAPAITPLGLTSSPHAPISRRLWAFMIASHGRATSKRILKGLARRRLNPLFAG